jgi:CDP-diglyceride synthetase
VTTTTNERATGRQREIGVIGTAARVILGLALVGSVVWGEHSAGLVPASWALGLLGFPAILVAWQWIRAHRSPGRFQATGPVGFTLNIMIFLALYLTLLYAPALAFARDATLIFYGGSMLLAAARGYAACEVLAASNWLLHRDDQVGCLVFAPIDHLEHR